MTVGITELLDLAISPQIGPVNFFHLRNLLHTIVEHFGIGEVETQQAEVRGPMSLRSSSEASSSVESSSDSEEDEGWCQSHTPVLSLITVKKLLYNISLIQIKILPDLILNLVLFFSLLVMI